MKSTLGNMQRKNGFICPSISHSSDNHSHPTENFDNSINTLKKGNKYPKLKCLKFFKSSLTLAYYKEEDWGI